jgi:tripartite-type tricarboxylate transporter receptor subunit TctC
VPFSAGGGQDLTARIQASYLSKKWGVPVNVVNKPGGITVPATVELYGAPPDGHTLYAEGSTVCFLSVRKLPFEIMDRTFVAITNVGPQVLYVPASSPYKTLKEVAAAAKKSPDTFTWGSLGGPSPTDFQIVRFLREAGVDHRKTKPVMTQGVSQIVTLVAGGHAMLGASSGTSTVPALKAGTIRALAVTGRDRYIDLPDVPTVTEAGYPMADVYNWFGISGPPKMPAYVVDIWNKTIEEMSKDPEVLANLRKIWQAPFYHNSSAMREVVRKTIAEVKEVWSEP